MNDLSKVSIKRIEGLEATIADIYAKIDDASGRGTAHSVGEVFWSQSNLAEENIGALPLFTGDHVAASTYSALHAFILRHNELVKTKQEYDALVADTTKDCPYYAIDNGQIYLPIIRNYLSTISTVNNQLSVEDTNLYPWVSYVVTVHDIVTPTEYAKADLSNVTGIDQSSAVATELSTKQDTITDLQTIRSGAAAGATALQSVPVATNTVVGGIRLEWDSVNKVLNIKTT